MKDLPVQRVLTSLPVRVGPREVNRVAAVYALNASTLEAEADASL